jgi:LPS O-antigen subunit length determinant protein (WzzB/FepE family)
MGGYQIFGPKVNDYKLYQRINFIDKITEGIEAEQVDEYSVPLGKLYRWLQMAVEMRKEDVLARRDYREKLKEERIDAQNRYEEREVQRQEAYEAAL